MAFVIAEIGADLGRFDAALRAAQARLSAFASGLVNTPAGLAPAGGADALVEGLADWLKAPPRDADAAPKIGKGRDATVAERPLSTSQADFTTDRGALLVLAAALRGELAHLGSRIAAPERETPTAPAFAPLSAGLRLVAAAAPAGGAPFRRVEHAPRPLGRTANVPDAIGTRVPVSRDERTDVPPRVLVQHDRARWDRAARFLSALHTREPLPLRSPDAPGPHPFNPPAATAAPPAQPRRALAAPGLERPDRQFGQANVAVREELTRFLDGLLQRLDAGAAIATPPRPGAPPLAAFPATRERGDSFGDPAALAGLLREALAGNGRLVAAAEVTARNTQELATLARKPPPPSPGVLVGPE